MTNNFDSYASCPCGSEKKSKFCCWTGKGWNKKPTLIKEMGDISGYSHQRCYAAKTCNCSTKISGEHFISNNILKDLEHENKVKIVGLPWQEKEKYKLLSRSKLASNILCTTHNSALSPFDSEMGRLERKIRVFDEGFNESTPKNDLAIFCGENLERWMLKTTCAMIASNQIGRYGEKLECKLKEIYVDILFNNAPFPENWGLYFDIPENGIIQKYHSISFMPLTVDNEVKGVEFLVNNFKFYLILGEFGDAKSFGIYRPRGIQLTDGIIKKKIEICWQDKRYNQGVFMDRKSTTKNFPNEWDDYLKK